MKEACVCFSEMELIQNQWMSCKVRQVLESKDVSKQNPPKKQVSLGTQQVWGGGEGDFATQGDKPCLTCSCCVLLVLYDWNITKTSSSADFFVIGE